MHGDFCDAQVCLTDTAPVLVDFESMFDLNKAIKVCASQEPGRGIAFQIDNGKDYGRATRSHYYNWHQLVLNKCRTIYSTGDVSVAEALAMEGRAFAVNILEHLFGQRSSTDDNFYSVQKIKIYHQSYFSYHQDQETKIINALEKIIVILLNLRRAKVTFAAAMPQLQDLVTQLPL